jgi:ElaB/YqjD/DUF883 family membrane-anchored ribosome-binding protein
VEFEGEEIMNTRDEVCNLTTDLKKVIRDSEDVLAAVAGDKAEAIREELSGLIATAREVCCKLEVKAKKGLHAADDTIRYHPYQSIGVAAALGLVVGILISRK